MELTCLADCGPSRVAIVLLLIGAALALLAARWKRRSVLLTVPLLLAALVVFGGEGYDHVPPWWLTAAVLGLPLIGLTRWRLTPIGTSKRPT